MTRQPRSPRDLVSLDIDQPFPGASRPVDVETVARAIELLRAEHRRLCSTATAGELQRLDFKAWLVALETSIWIFSETLREEGEHERLAQALAAVGYPRLPHDEERGLILRLGKRPSSVMRRWELEREGLSRDEIMLRMIAELFNVPSVTMQEVRELLSLEPMLPEQHPLASCTCSDCKLSGRRPRPPKLPPHETPRQ